MFTKIKVNFTKIHFHNTDYKQIFLIILVLKMRDKKIDRMRERERDSRQTERERRTFNV